MLEDALAGYHSLELVDLLIAGGLDEEASRYMALLRRLPHAQHPNDV
jgi:hypothetical protein